MSRGTKGAHRARIMRGMRNDRDFEAPWMKKPLAERHEDQKRRANVPAPLEQDTDPRGLPYMVRSYGDPLPCYTRPPQKKG